MRPGTEVSRTRHDQNLFRIAMMEGIPLPQHCNATSQSFASIDMDRQPRVMHGHSLFGAMHRVVGVFHPNSWQVRVHVEANGSLCVFPEGKINRNPAILCPFRRGSFAMVEEMNMAVVTMTSVGNNDTWPRDHQVGGLPARVTMKLTEVAGAGHSLTSAAIQEKAEVAMQADLTYLLRQRNGSKSKES